MIALRLADVSAALSSVPNGVILLATVCGALAALWRFLRLGELFRSVRTLAKLSELQETFLRDWMGEEARPGVEARPGFPARIAKVEAHMHEIKGRDAQLAQSLGDIAASAQMNGEKVDRLYGRVEGVDARITDHRRRNEEQAKILREDLDRRARELEEKLQERNRAVDERLAHISDDLMRGETMRAALVELGLEIDPPPEH